MMMEVGTTGVTETSTDGIDYSITASNKVSTNKKKKIKKRHKK